MTRITIDTSGFEELIDQWEIESVWQIVFEELEKTASRLAGTVIRESLSGKLLRRRTGALARSVVGRVERVQGIPAIRVGVFRGPSLAYAGIQEEGGVVKPKRAKNLAIPVNEAKTPAGVDRFGGPRGYPGALRFVPFRRGVATGALYDENELVQAEEEGFSIADIKPLYILVKRVRIPASRWLSKPIRENLPKVTAEIADAIRKGLT